MTDNVIPFKKHEPDDMIWRCDCGCTTHYAHADGRLTCAQCQRVASGAGGGWRLALPDDPTDTPELLSDGDLKITDLDSAENAIRRVLKCVNPDTMAFLIVAQQDGRLNAWGLEMDTNESRAWLKRKLKQAHSLLVPPAGKTI